MQKRIVIPRQKATLILNPDSLFRLPLGAGYTVSEGRAKASVIRDTEGLRFDSDCDSLTVMVEELQRDVFRLSREKTELSERTDKVRTIEVNRLTGLQSFQIWTGRICLLLIVVAALLKAFQKARII